MLTLNNIVNEIRTFATNHEQINSFQWSTVVNVGDEAPVYPLLVSELSETSAEFDENADAYFIDFSILGKPNLVDEYTSTLETLSDTKLIANDLVSYFKRHDFGVKFKIDLPVQMQALERIGTDSISGWTFTLKITLPQGIDNCTIPILSYLQRQDGGYLLRQDGGYFLRN